MKKNKILFIFILIIIFIVTFIAVYFILTIHSILGNETYLVDNDIENYKGIYESPLFLRGADEVLPELNDLPEYINIFYEYRHQKISVLYKETIILVVAYDEITYEEEKVKLEDRNFLSQPIPELMPKNEFTINNYYFRVLDEENTDFRYPKYWGMIATSDEKNSIAYIYHHDTSMDNMYLETEKYIKKVFKYKW